MKFCNAHKVGWFLGGIHDFGEFQRQTVGRSVPDVFSFLPRHKTKTISLLSAALKNPSSFSLFSFIKSADDPTQRQWFDWNVTGSLLLFLFFSEPAIWGIPGKNTRDCWPIRNVKKTICFARIFTVSEKGFSWLGSGCCLAHFICEFDVLLWIDIVSLPILTLLSPAIAHKTWQKPEEKKEEVGRLPSYSHPETGDDCKTAIGRNFYWLANHIYCFLFANSIYSPIFLFWSIASHGLLYFSPYSLGQWPGKDKNIILYM